MDKKQFDEFRVAVRHLCDMAALYANEDSEATSLECEGYIRTCSKFLEALENEHQ